MNKLCVFQILDKTGFVDEYVYYYLNSLLEFTKDILIFAPENIDAEASEKLKGYTSKLYTYHDGDALYNLLHKQPDIKYEAYDQVLFTNDTCFGPIYPLNEMFSVMEEGTADFWSITQNGPMLVTEGSYRDKTYETYFLCFKGEALSAYLINRSNKEIAKDTFRDITAFLENNGFQGSAYIQAAKYQTEQIEKSVDCSRLLSYELIREYRCPMIRKDVFNASDYLKESGENAKRTLDYIAGFTKYDEKLIWNHLIRTGDMYDLRRVFHMDYILPWEVPVGNLAKLQQKRVAVILHLHYQDLVEECFQSIQAIPQPIHVYITVSNAVTRAAIEEKILQLNLCNCRIVEKDNRGRDVSSLLVACREMILNYDYVCFLHDKKSSQMNYITEGKSFMYDMWENMIKSTSYLWNIIDLFENNPQLGLLVPPEPFHGSYIRILGNSWTVNYHQTLMLADRLGLKVNISESKPPFTVGTTFWCRVDAMKALFCHEFQYEDFPQEPMETDGTVSHAVERILAYVAKHEGYATGTVSNTEYASLRITGIQTEFTEVLNSFRAETFSPVNNMDDVRTLFTKERELVNFCNRYQYVYIFSAAIGGRKCAKSLENYQKRFEGFIVSEGCNDNKIVDGHPVYLIKEIKHSPKECGIIVPISKKFRNKVLKELQEFEFDNLYLI